MIFSFKAEGLQAVDELLHNLNVNAALEDAVFDVANEFENEAVTNIQERIYAKPESPYYRRTGALQGGRSNEQQGPLRRRVRFNPEIRGAGKDYAPMTNKNRRIARLNTYWYDDARKAIKPRSKELLRKALRRRLGKTGF